MLKKNYKNVEKMPVTLENTKDAFVRWLIDENDGAKYYAMRRFEVKPNGSIPLHEHPEDHEIYILNGNGNFYNDTGQKEIVYEGDVLYIPPNEKHGIKNLGKDDLIFICIILIIKNKD
jgi:quercetin dioxygenase-like cupin family protein